MSKTRSLRLFLTERLTAAAEEIFGAVEQTIVEYEEEVSRCQKEVDRLQNLLDIVLKPEIKLHRVPGELVQQATVPVPEADHAPGQQHREPEWSPDQWWRPGLGQGDPGQDDPGQDDPGPETTHIKEELGPLSISQGEELETDTIDRFILTPHIVNCLDQTQSSYLYQPQLGGDNRRRDVVSLTVTSVTEHSKPEPDEEDYLVSVPTVDSPVAPNVFAAQNDTTESTSGQEGGGGGGGGGGGPGPSLSKRWSVTTQQSPVATNGQTSKETTHLIPPARRGNNTLFPRLCKLCGMSFRSIAPLTAHVQTHAGDGERLCGVCGRRLASTENMSVHLQGHLGAEVSPGGGNQRFPDGCSPTEAHTSSQPGVKACHCLVCGKAFATSYEMTVHKRIHTGERPYRCQVCGKGFAQSTSLKVHMQFHSGERRHRCNVCSKSFCASNHLTAHMMTHTGEKPHLCSFCGKGFIWSEDLKKHMRIHTGERPYRCLFCDKAFSQNGNLRSHMKRTHVVETVLQSL